MGEETNSNCYPTHNLTSWGYPPAIKHNLIKNKMELVFENYQAVESTLSSLGTVAKAIGQNGSINLIPSNYKNDSVRVKLILKKEDGTSTGVTCSQKVSDGLRDKSITMGHLLNFEVLYGESGIPFISLPGGGLVEFAVKDLRAVDYKVATVDFADLIA